jgi:hypothetical protein
MKKSEWICFKDTKTNTMITAIVANEKGWMYGTARAIYHPAQEAWVLYDPDSRESLLLEVTHYIEIPDFQLASSKK